MPRPIRYEQLPILTLDRLFRDYDSSILNKCLLQLRENIISIYTKNALFINTYNGHRKLSDNFTLEHASTTVYYETCLSSHDLKQKHHCQFWHWHSKMAFT